MQTGLYSMNFGTRRLEPIDESEGDKNNLQVGTVLFLNGYDDPSYVITRNLGINGRFPYYGADYETINLQDGTASRHQAYTMKWMREKKDNRIQVYITDRVMSADEMKEALDKAAVIKAENDRKACEKAEAQAREIKELPAQFPYLTPMNESMKYKGHVLGAKNIRLELKRIFPTVKFSVRSESYSGGDHININWTDGPTVKEVEAITGKYQEGSFNGMEDIYEHNHDNQFQDVFGGSKYVFENRHESPELILRVAKKMGYDLSSGECDNYGRLPGLNDETSQTIYREARSTRT